MTIVISLSPEMEERLRQKAIQQGQDINILATQLLANVLEWELQDSQEAIAGVQKGLDDFAHGRFRSFDDFAQEQRQKYNL